jgi:uncharacterized protein with von Willebrand factor type A (vWA) domain
MDRFSSARQLVEEGGGKRSDFSQFAADVHGRLYLHNEPERTSNAPDWAARLHDAAGELSEWQQLRTRCQADGFAAGVATEVVLQALLPQLQAEQKKDQGGDQDQNKPGQGNGNGQELRAAIRRACRQATQAVDQAEAALDGLDESLGITRPGTGIGEVETLKDVDSVREVYKTLQNSSGLRNICEIAGRMIRSARLHKRTKVSNAVGAIKGLTLGGDVARVLPSELAGLRGNRIQRLMTLSKVMEKRALQYLMRGEQTETRGPIVLLVDESSSMQVGGKETWSKALALAILSTAVKQNRVMYFVGFSCGIRRSMRIDPRAVDFNRVAGLLNYRSSGGTSFDAALTKALEVIDSEPTFKKADIILVTDGEDEVSTQIETDLLRRREEDGLQLYGIGVGSDAEITSSLGSVATSLTRVNPWDDHDVVAPIINLEA